MPTVAILIAAIVVLLVCITTHYGRPRQALEGFWSGDAEFLDESGLDSMFLTLDPSTKTSSPRRFRAHILMSTEEGIICNTSGELRLTGPFPLAGLLGRAVYRAPCRLELDEPGPLPTRAQLVLDHTTGTMALNDGKKVLAVLRREL